MVQHVLTAPDSYLAMLRPPVREQCLDFLEELWRTREYRICWTWEGFADSMPTEPDLRKQISKPLQRWRPAVLPGQDGSKADVKMDGGDATAGAKTTLAVPEAGRPSGSPAQGTTSG